MSKQERLLARLEADARREAWGSPHRKEKMEEKIPELSKKRLEKLVKKIKPLVRFVVKFRTGEFELELGKDGKPKRAYGNPLYWALFEIEPVDPMRTAYTWDPKPTKMREDVACFDIIRTYHKYGAPFLFKPSIAEVLAQIPEDVIDKTVGFEILDHRELDSSNCLGYHHVVLTRLFMDGKQWHKENMP